MSSGLYDLITVAAPSVQKTCDRSAPTCRDQLPNFQRAYIVQRYSRLLQQCHTSHSKMLGGHASKMEQQTCLES